MFAVTPRSVFSPSLYMLQRSITLVYYRNDYNDRLYGTFNYTAELLSYYQVMHGGGILLTVCHINFLGNFHR